MHSTSLVHMTRGHAWFRTIDIEVTMASAEACTGLKMSWQQRYNGTVLVLSVHVHEQVSQGVRDNFSSTCGCSLEHYTVCSVRSTAALLTGPYRQWAQESIGCDQLGTRAVRNTQRLGYNTDT
jgi:hypothetical protein